jgi:hypothetical protein
VNIVIRSGSTETVKRVRVKVTNADILPQTENPGHVIRLLASDGDCPAGTLLGPPDFDRRTVGAQDSTRVLGGRTKAALMQVRVTSAGFDSFSRGAPHRCRLQFEAVVDTPGNADPSPQNNAMAVELDVIDQNDAEQTTLFESLASSIRPTKIIVRRGLSQVIKPVRLRVANGNAGGGPDSGVSVVVSGDCPAGTVDGVDFDSRQSGVQGLAVVSAGRKASGFVPLTINASAFTSPNRKTPARCTAVFTVNGPSGDTDASNNSTRLVIDVIDKNDF